MTLWSHLQDDSAIQSLIYSGDLMHANSIQRAETSLHFLHHLDYFDSPVYLWDIQTLQQNFRTAWHFYCMMRSQMWPTYSLMTCLSKDQCHNTWIKKENLR